MKTTRLLNKIAVIIAMVLLTVSCKMETGQDKFGGTWTAVAKTENGYQIIDRGLPSEQIIIAGDSISHKGIMEDVSFKADHIEKDEHATTFFPLKDARSFYRFTWADKQQGIAKCEISTDGTKVTRFFVDRTKAGNIRTVKDSNASDITEKETGDHVNDSLMIGDGSKILYVEDDDCLAIRDKKGNQLLDRCFEAFILRIRPVKGNLLPLTFIAGSRSVDIDFFAAGDQWISKTATYYRPVDGHEEKTTRPYVTSVRDFDLDDVVTRFEKPATSNTDTLKRDQVR